MMIPTITAAQKSRNTISVMMLMVPSVSLPQISWQADGSLAMIPAKMISEIPLPIPCSLICSPSHMRKAVPAVSTMTITMTENTSVLMRACLNSPIVTPIACTTARATVRYLVYCAIFFLPSVPSLDSLSSAGTAIVRSWSIMDAVM